MQAVFSRLQVTRREFGAALLVVALAGLALQTFLVRRAMAEQGFLAGQAAGTIAAGLRSEIEKFELVAVALSTDREARDLLVAPTPQRQVALNRRLLSLRDELGASVIYVMNLEGDTLVASNWQQTDSFVGQNYRFRSYFRGALQLGEQRQYALGTRSRIPGLYLARRLTDGGHPVGVIVVKIRFDRLEREWRSYPGHVFATNTDGVILITDDPARRFRTLTPLSEERRTTLRGQLDFGDASLTTDPSLGSGGAAGTNTVARQIAAGAGLTLHVVQPVSDARRNAQLAAWGFTLALATAAAALLLFVRSRRQAVQLAAQRDAAQRIDVLKEELAQANRLAILGQIVAGVGHEIGQPVTAISIQADTGRKLAAAGNAPAAAQAFERIGDLTKRIAAITGELRRFSRRSLRDAGPSPIAEAVGGALQLLSNRITASGTRVDFNSGEQNLRAAADPQRCEQILVNLLQNALDATAGQAGAAITVTVAQDGCNAVVEVADNGCGIDPAMLPTLFQPFHTGKATGLGLGLVISRDLARDLGGDLALIEGASGARFRLTLPLAS